MKYDLYIQYTTHDLLEVYLTFQPLTTNKGIFINENTQNIKNAYKGNTYVLYVSVIGCSVLLYMSTRPKRVEIPQI